MGDVGMYRLEYFCKWEILACCLVSLGVYDCQLGIETIML